MESAPTNVDTDKRNFLRLVGVVGLGVIASQAFPDTAKAAGPAGLSGVVGVRNHLGTRIDPMLEGGNLATIATNIPAQGWASMDSSMPVALASNQPKLAGKLQDGSGNPITSTSSALDLNIQSGDAERSYADGSTTASATGTLALTRSGTALKGLQTGAQGNLKIDDGVVDLASINGEPIMTAGAPGILPTTLVDMGGNPIDTFAGSLQVKVSNPRDMRLAAQDLVLTGTAQRVGLYLIKPTDVSGYALGFLQVGGVFVATYNFEGSNSIRNAVWAAIPVRNMTLGTFVISNTVVGQYEIPLSYKYLRVRISAFTSGLPQATLRLSPLPTNTNAQRLGHVAAGADGVTANVTTPNILPSTGAVAPLAVMPSSKNATTYDIAQGVVDGTNDDGGGVRARGLLAQS